MAYRDAMIEVFCFHSSIDMWRAQVLESWKSRLESASEDTALEQIEACAKISVACVDIDPENRPSIQDIQDILDKLDEVETLDGFIQNSESSMLLAQVSLLRDMLYYDLYPS